MACSDAQSTYPFGEQLGLGCLMSKTSARITDCRLKELYREACRIYPYLHAVKIVDRSAGRRIGKDELRDELIGELSGFNEYLRVSSIPGSCRKPSTCSYYLATCVALGILERLGDVSARPDFTITSRGIVLVFAQKVLPPSEDWQLNPLLKFFVAKILWEDDGLCLGALLELFGKKKSLSELHPLYSTAYPNRNQFFHIMKPHVEWLVDLGLLDREKRNRETVFVRSDSLEPRRTWSGLLSPDYDHIESCLNLLFLEECKSPLQDEVEDYVKYSYRLLETQRSQLAGDYVSVSTLLDVAQLLMALAHRFAPRRIIEKHIVELIDANRDQISVMEAMTGEKGAGFPMRYGPVHVSYLRVLDPGISRPRRTTNKLGINRIDVLLRP